MEQFKYPINDTRFETPSWTKAEHMESIAPLADLWGLDDNVQEKKKKTGFWKGLLFSILEITGLR